MKANEMTKTVDAMRATATTAELLAALYVEQDAYLEAGDKAAANEVQREINLTKAYGPQGWQRYAWFRVRHHRKAA